MKKFHITITSNDTGEVHVDHDTVCIIGACENGGVTRVMGFGLCTNEETICTTTGALEAVERRLQGMPLKIQRLIRKTAKAESNGI